MRSGIAFMYHDQDFRSEAHSGVDHRQDQASRSRTAIKHRYKAWTISIAITMSDRASRSGITKKDHHQSSRSRTSIWRGPPDMMG